METAKSANPKTGETEDKRVIRVQPSEKYESKDRTGQLGGIIEPEFTKIINACQGNEIYSWSSAKAKKNTNKGESEESTQEDDSEETKKSAKSKLDKSL
jgi:hypothetical protein